MDLTNKQVSINTMSVSTFPPETTVKVEVRQALTDSVYKTLGTYEIKFPMVYMGSDQAALMAAIYEKLAEIPE